MSKLRVSFAKEKGVVFASGDVAYSVGDTKNTWSGKWWEKANRRDQYNGLMVRSFASRKNTGEQMCGDDVPVVCIKSSGRVYSDIASDVVWCIDSNDSDIDTWQPDIEALVKMQDEHDKKALADLKPEPKTVVDAVNHYKGQNSRDHIIFKYGRWSGCDFAHWQKFSVCTFAEFNQCVEELSVEAVKPKPFFRTGEAFEHTKTLNFILERMINIHGEHESVDYIHKLRNAIIFVEKSESPKQKIELPNPRMKTEYVHCSIEDAKKYHCDELFFRYGDEKIEPLRDVDAAFFIINQHKLCRKVEREYTWKEVIHKDFDVCVKDGYVYFGKTIKESGFFEMCSIVHNAKVGE